VAAGADETYDRQSRLYGDRGLAILCSQKVAVIGAGARVSLAIEYLHASASATWSGLTPSGSI